MVKKIALLTSVLCIALSGCPKSQAKNDANSNVTPTATADPVQTSISPVPSPSPTSSFKPNFIKADLLKKSLDKQENIFIIDVRGEASYGESHIKGSRSIPLPITEESVKDIPKSTKIVTYCGCPHHLSSIGAEQLTNIGYKDVSVLDEGFWYWKDHKYPLETVKKDTKVTEVKVSGTLVKDGKPVVDSDIYLKHEKSGQLEATRTDAKGIYEMHFKIYNYTEKDKFNFYVEDLSKPVQEFITDKNDNKNIIVNMK